jgi:hypothetical protein
MLHAGNKTAYCASVRGQEKRSTPTVTARALQPRARRASIFWNFLL